MVSKVVLTAAPNPAASGQKVTLTATVPQVGATVPTGNVTISETEMQDGTPIIPPIIYGNADLVNGVASIEITSTSAQTLSVGTHILFATYGGQSVPERILQRIYLASLHHDRHRP